LPEGLVSQLFELKFLSCLFNKEFDNPLFYKFPQGFLITFPEDKVHPYFRFETPQGQGLRSQSPGISNTVIFYLFFVKHFQIPPELLLSEQDFMHPDPELGKTQGKEKFFGFFDFLESLSSYWLSIGKTCSKTSCSRSAGCGKGKLGSSLPDFIFCHIKFHKRRKNHFSSFLHCPVSRTVLSPYFRGICSLKYNSIPSFFREIQQSSSKAFLQK